MPSKDIAPHANTWHVLFNFPHALKKHCTQCHHHTPPFQLWPCPRITFHTVQKPQTPFSTAPSPSIHISPSANTSHPLSKCPHALKAHPTKCQHLKPAFLVPCPYNTSPPVPTPQTPFSTPLIPTKNISRGANTSNALFNCPHALTTRFTQYKHLKPPFQMHQCPQIIFHTVPTSHTPFSTSPMPSIHISHSANTSNSLFNCPHSLKTHFTLCQHLTPLFKCLHALKAYFPVCQHLKPPFLVPCLPNTFQAVPTPQIPFSIAPMPSKHISRSDKTSNPLFNYLHAIKTHYTQSQHLKPTFQLPPYPQNTFHAVPTPHTPFSNASMP